MALSPFSSDGTEIIVAASQSRLRVQFETIELRVVTGTDAGLEISLGLPTVRIGTAPDNDVVLTDRAVSRRHAQIASTAEGWMLRDLSSENGTYVNGQRVTERLLADGDRVQFGTSRFLFKSA